MADTAGTEALFPWHADPPPPDPLAGLSPGARRTQRQLTALRRGVHPLAAVVSTPYLMRLHPEAAPVEDRKAPGRRCGNCWYRQLVGGAHDGRFPKCTWPGVHPYPRWTSSAATDCRAWWPGCSDHEYGDPRLSPDAARYVPEAVAHAG